jgi:hypothetical protein
MQPNQLPALLYRYFSQTGEVSIPSLGQLSLTKATTINDFSIKELKPVLSTIEFHNGDLPIHPKQFEYLVKNTGTPKEQVNDALVLLGEELHERLQHDKKLDWMGVGVFAVDEQGTIQFHPKSNYVELFKPLQYKHVIRQDAVYEMRVGEEQKSVVEMENFFEEQRSLAGKSNWFRGALILLGCIVLALFIRYSKGSFSLLEGRYNKIQFKTQQTTYKIL